MRRHTRTESQYLAIFCPSRYDLVVGVNSELGAYVQKGDHNSARLLVRLVAHRLGQLSTVPRNSARFQQRYAILSALLHALQKLTISDEVGERML